MTRRCLSSLICPATRGMTSSTASVPMTRPVPLRSRRSDSPDPSGCGFWPSAAPWSVRRLATRSSGEHRQRSGHFAGPLYCPQRVRHCTCGLGNAERHPARPSWTSLAVLLQVGEKLAQPGPRPAATAYRMTAHRSRSSCGVMLGLAGIKPAVHVVFVVHPALLCTTQGRSQDTRRWHPRYKETWPPQKDPAVSLTTVNVCLRIWRQHTRIISDRGKKVISGPATKSPATGDGINVTGTG